MIQYSFNGVWLPVIRVNWFCIKDGGFIVRRLSRTGYVTGNLTDRGGWGGAHIAKVFSTAQEAANAAAHAGCRFFAVLHNQRGVRATKTQDILDRRAGEVVAR